MTTRHAISGRVGALELVLAALLAMGLALPFIHPPWEHEIRIAVRFRTGDMTRPGGFTVRTSSTICYVLSAVLSYRDPSGEGFIQVDCDKRAVGPAEQIRAERTALRQAVAADTAAR